MAKKSRNSIIIGMTSIFLVMLVLVGLTYAYYRTRIIGNESTEPSLSVTTKDLTLVYADGSPNIEVEKLVPSGNVYVKEFSVENTGSSLVQDYVVYMEEVINEFERYNDLQINLVCESINTQTNETSGTCEGISTHFPNFDDLLVVNDIDVNIKHKYKLELTYNNLTDVDQSVDMGKIIEGKIQIYNLSDILNFNVSNKQYLMKKLYDQDVEFGDIVNYNAGVDSYTGTWNVLGIEDGSILLLSEVIGEMTLSGANGTDGYDTNNICDTKECKYGYNNAIEGLNLMCEKYSNGVEAISARSITAEDINALSGFYPEKTYKGTAFVAAHEPEAVYGKEVTYKLVSTDGELQLLFDNGNSVINGGAFADPEVKIFTNIDGTVLQENESITIRNDFYQYQLQSWDTIYTNTIINLKASTKAVKMLNSNAKYWLATQSIMIRKFGTSWGIMNVENFSTYIRPTRTYSLVNSRIDATKPTEYNSTHTMNVRAVVKLSPDVKFTKVSTSNNVNTWDITI